MVGGDPGEATAWGWLRGFAWFLIAWPALSLLALRELVGHEWELILLAMLGPAGVGVLLLGLVAGLDRFVGTAGRPQARPSLLRDVSNTALTVAVLLGIDLALVLAFEEENLFARDDFDAGPMTAWVLAGAFGTALVLRVLHRVAFGKDRRGVDLGEGWGHAPTLTRLFGYLTLIPMLLVYTVMIDYALRGTPGFGIGGWVGLTALLWLGLRSAMAGPPRRWAGDPWRAYLRGESIAFPWWVIASALALGFGALFVMSPWLDDDMTTFGRVLAGVLLMPLGGFVYAAWLLAMRRIVPSWMRTVRLAWRARIDPSVIVAWSLDGEGDHTEVVLHARDGAQGRLPSHAGWTAWLREHVGGPQP